MAEKLRQPSEAQIQADFFTWLALHEKKYPELGLFYAVPNGSYKSPAARGLYKRTGLKSGVPDVHLPISCWPEYCGLWIEFKTDSGRLTPSQKEWIEKLEQNEHRVEVCRSWIEAVNVTIEYLGLPIPTLSEQQNGRRGKSGGKKPSENF